MQLSVVIPTHNPDAGRLRRTLDGLRAQTLPAADWETILVDNASAVSVSLDAFGEFAPSNARIVHEPQLGLTAARRRGFTEARGGVMVLVDDDNVLAPSYLEFVLQIFAAHPRVGAIGGRSFPEFERQPPAWMREFDDLIACRDPGPEPRLASSFRTQPAGRIAYPDCAPIGAGMALRRDAAALWLAASNRSVPTDRRGTDLTSGGDNDIILTLAREWDVGYFPALTLTHLIPEARTTLDYLARLNHGIAKSWVQVLHQHQANPWPAIASWTVPLRKLKAWFAYRSWSSPAAYVRWRGACGHFEGRAAV